MEKKKKNIVIGITSLLLVTLILLGLTYAYYKTRIVGNTSDKSVSVVSKNLSVTYQNESAEISATGIEPGYSATKTFEVKNTGSGTVEYSVMLDNVTNTFARDEDWTYTISENETELKSGTLPNSDSYILYSESIDAGATKSYTLKIDYVNSAEDQSEDMGKSMSFRININDGLGTTLTSAEEGTLLYAIGHDSNIVVNPNTNPGETPSGTATYIKSKLITDKTYTGVPSPNMPEYVRMTYGDGYEFDETTKKYKLINARQTTDVYANSYNEIIGKYVFFNQDAGDAYYYSTPNDSNSETIGKVISATSSSYTFQLLASLLITSEAELAVAEDDYGTSYYYRGIVDNNYVNYSGMCWRIVRVQGDGNIKLILADEENECNSGVDAGNTTNGNAIVASTEWGGTGTVEERLIFANSSIPTQLSDWATEKNLDMTKLVDAEWCNDTSIASITDETANGGPISVSYGASNRKKSPTLKCNMIGLNNSTLTKYVNKLGILSWDENLFAGDYYHSYTSFYAGENSSYLNVEAYNLYWWTMTPSYFHKFTSSIVASIYVGGVYSGSTNVFNTSGGDKVNVRPSIVLASNVTISSGNGTVENPYIVG